VQCPKWPLVITLKGCGLLHKSRRPKRLHKAISSQPTWGGYRTVSVVTKYSIHRNSPSIKKNLTPFFFFDTSIDKIWHIFSTKEVY
jgi:hypothetical protein